MPAGMTLGMIHGGDLLGHGAAGMVAGTLIIIGEVGIRTIILLIPHRIIGMDAPDMCVEQDVHPVMQIICAATAIIHRVGMPEQ